MVSRSTLFRTVCVGLVSIIVSCGEASFNSVAGVAKKDDNVAKSGDALPAPIIDPVPVPTETPGGGASSTRFDSMLWFFQCESSPSAVPAPRSAKDVIAVGTGDYKYKREEIDGIPVTITGKVCPAVTKRDIVFVIDISGSMNTNDRLRADGTCGRYDSVMAVVNSIAAGTSVQYSGVTFNSATAQQSTAFVSNAALMFGSQNLASVVCATGGNTNYSAPLSSSLNLLQTARADASQEVYFVTDGRPEDGSGNGVVNSAINGVAQATSIKARGATIATIMLGADAIGNTHLKDSIASNTGTGDAKMHENVTETSKLANSLRDLAANDVKSGEIMYRAVGAVDWKKFDMTKHRVGDSFALPSFPLVLAEVPEGVEVKFTYEDRRGKSFSGQGTLNFEFE